MDKSLKKEVRERNIDSRKQTQALSAMGFLTWIRTPDK